MVFRHAIAEEINEILSDPDYGANLQESFEKKLKKSISEEQEGKLVPFSAIIKQHP
jgi:hypothetical protein